MRAAKNGEEAAWEAVFLRFDLMLRGHVRTLVARHRRPVDADDLVQATFERAWSQIQDFDYLGEGSFRRWLHTLAKNLYLNQIKSDAARPEQRAATEVIENAVDEREAERQSAQVERLSLDEAMAELDDDDREILLMHSDERLSMEEIAEILQCPLATAKKRLASAFGRLRLRMGGSAA